MDLVLEFDDEFVVIDHKSFPGGRSVVLQKVESFGGQLKAYAEAIKAATGRECAGGFVHLPVSGTVVEILAHVP